MRKILITGLVMLGLTMGYSYAGLQEFDLGLAEEITANVDMGYSLLLQSNANFIVNDEYKIIRFQGNASNYNRIITYFWNGSGMYMISTKNYGDYGVKAEGFLNYVNIVTLSTIDYTNNVPVGYTPIAQFINDTKYKDPDKLLLGGYGDLQVQSLCFGYTEYDEAVCFTLNDADIGNNLSNSMGLGVQSIENLVDYATYSPFTKTTPSGKPDTEGVCMTIQDMLDRQNGTYNTGLCYSNNRYLTSTGRVENPPKFITDIYPTYTELREDMNLYMNYCRPPATMSYCQQGFAGKEDSYTLIQKIPAEAELTVLYDFCTTYQTWSGDLQKNVCDMTEEERKNLRPSQMTQEGYADRITKHPTTTTTPTTGTVYDDITDQQNRDILEAIPRVYTKITGIFKARSGVNGIIPDYITWLLLLIVLFKLFKK